MAVSKAKASSTSTTATRTPAKKRIPGALAARRAPAKTSTAKKPVAKTTTKTTTKKTATRKAAPRTAAPASAADLGAAQRIDRRIASLDDWRGQRMAELRRLIHDADPQVVEHWKWMGTPVWSHDGMYVLANAHKDKVKLMFFHGAKLPDPGKLFNASLDGGTWRAIDFREGDTIDTPALKALLREAIAYNTTHPVPKSKGSRRTG